MGFSCTVVGVLGDATVLFYHFYLHLDNLFVFSEWHVFYFGFIVQVPHGDAGLFLCFWYDCVKGIHKVFSILVKMCGLSISHLHWLPQVSLTVCILPALGAREACLYIWFIAPEWLSAVFTVCVHMVFVQMHCLLDHIYKQLFFQ